MAIAGASVTHDGTANAEVGGVTSTAIRCVDIGRGAHPPFLHRASIAAAVVVACVAVITRLVCSEARQLPTIATQRTQRPPCSSVDNASVSRLNSTQPITPVAVHARSIVTLFVSPHKTVTANRIELCESVHCPGPSLRRRHQISHEAIGGASHLPDHRRHTHPHRGPRPRPTYPCGGGGISPASPGESERRSAILNGVAGCSR
mmetsp:Transcript_10741/g.25108  ORF Transcript_10741/g.25108 Transcript_10741/m.25108 type:complete len:204 (-) Transcript_10741:49-660(-)